MRRRLLLSLSFLLAQACHRQAPASQNRFAVSLVADAPPEDPVVATVDGRPLHASEVATQARARGSDAKQALADLIDAEVLAGEAARRGLDRMPAVREAAQASAVRRFLALGFEREVTPPAIPIRDVRRAYQMNINLFDHSEYVDVWHVLVPVGSKASPAQRAAARAVAEEVARRARAVAGADPFRELAKQIAPPPGGDPLRTEQIITARDGWTLKTFSYPAFELKRPGETSGVVETDYGYHVIFLNRRIPPAHIPVDEIAPQLRMKIFPEFQKHEFLHFVENLAAKHRVVEHPEHLP